MFDYRNRVTNTLQKLILIVILNNFISVRKMKLKIERTPNAAVLLAVIIATLAPPLLVAQDEPTVDSYPRIDAVGGRLFFQSRTRRSETIGGGQSDVAFNRQWEVGPQLSIALSDVAAIEPYVVVGRKIEDVPFDIIDEEGPFELNPLSENTREQSSLEIGADYVHHGFSNRLVRFSGNVGIAGTIFSVPNTGGTETIDAYLAFSTSVYGGILFELSVTPHIAVRLSQEVVRVEYRRLRDERSGINNVDNEFLADTVTGFWPTIGVFYRF